ncbi:MAG: 23S rRNA (adenine(1618)-N(6))-methyltransferase RlmF [Methylophilaceae bacterium]|nr:23S rRNA (adenine(1618)-N(6))-methyltransferase RlmF [Methylophilaceae bacterium]
MKPELIKTDLHPRNQHRQRYDFTQLIASSGGLKPYVKPNKYGDDSIDFANPLAVKALNQALLKHCYDVAVWDIPSDYLCPPIPGRADYIHYLADLLNESTVNMEPIRLLDVGVGANLIYPLIGQHTYGWHFVGADIDRLALQNAQQLINANQLNEQIELRLQQEKGAIFKGVIQPSEQFTATLCNPPFHASLAEAQAGTQRKWRGLGKHGKAGLNFGGQSNELYCAGGEAAFVKQMIDESQLFANQCKWFTTLIAKASTLPSVYAALKKAGALEVKTVEMRQGQKQSRMVAWSFFVA